MGHVVPDLIQASEDGSKFFRPLKVAQVRRVRRRHVHHQVIRVGAETLCYFRVVVEHGFAILANNLHGHDAVLVFAEIDPNNPMPQRILSCLLPMIVDRKIFENAINKILFTKWSDSC